MYIELTKLTDVDEDVLEHIVRVRRAVLTLDDIKVSALLNRLYDHKEMRQHTLKSLFYYPKSRELHAVVIETVPSPACGKLESFVYRDDVFQPWHHVTRPTAADGSVTVIDLTSLLPLLY